MGMQMHKSRRARIALAGSVIALATASSAAALQALPPGGQVNDDLAAGIDKTISVNGDDPTNSDVVGGALTAGKPAVPWAVFRQQERNGSPPPQDQIFSRSFAGGAWTTRGIGTVGGRSSASPTFKGSLNFDQGQAGEAPAIDFAGAGRTVPWATWYENTSGTGFGNHNVFASRFDNTGDANQGKWIFGGQSRGTGGGGRVHGHVADLALMSNVRVLADEIRGRYQHVDVLANNAGALFASRKETPEGFEQTFALNHLAPFLLTNLLRDRLAGGRVVTTASNAHKSARLDLEDLQSERSYSPRVYGISKLYNILFTRELARRAPELRANCFHPGVVRTGFAKNENGIWKGLATLGAPFFRSPERGARSLVWLALSDEAAALTGKYIEDEKVVAPSAQAQDNKLAQNLWERSAQLVSLPTDARG